MLNSFKRIQLNKISIIQFLSNPKVQNYTFLNTFEDYENLADYDYEEKNLYTDEFKNSHLKLNMLIKIFGRLENGETITVNVTNFTPYFHIKIPNDWTPKQCDNLVKEIKNKIYFKI